MKIKSLLLRTAIFTGVMIFQALCVSYMVYGIYQIHNARTFKGVLTDVSVIDYRKYEIKLFDIDTEVTYTLRLRRNLLVLRTDNDVFEMYNKLKLNNYYSATQLGDGDIMYIE